MEGEGETRFDAVIGNPPYSVALNGVEKAYWKKRFTLAPHPHQLSGLFYVASLKQYSNNSRVGMIIPKINYL
jgi:type I restriction-modification system DNA methylase subunit